MRFLFVLTLVASLIVSISASVTFADEPTANVPPAASEASGSKNAVNESQPSPNDKVVKEGGAIKAVAPFTPPFPLRDEIFQPPNNKGLSKAQREEVRTEVALKGFANVDGIKAILAINGKTFSLGVGESQSGVEVVGIVPPEVKLQRGRVRWSESLYPNGNR